MKVVAGSSFVAIIACLSANVTHSNVDAVFTVTNLFQTAQGSGVNQMKPASARAAPPPVNPNKPGGPRNQVPIPNVPMNGRTAPLSPRLAPAMQSTVNINKPGGPRKKSARRRHARRRARAKGAVGIVKPGSL